MKLLTFELTSYLRLLSTIARLKMKISPMPYKYIFLVTNLCNSRCKTCFIWKIYKEKPSLLNLELKKEEYERIFEDIKKVGLWLNFSGGEPFLRKDLEDIVITSGEIMKKVFLINIPTNGLEPKLIREKVHSILSALDSKKVFYITISLDGIGENYKKIRGVDGFERVMRTYEYLLRLKKEYDNFFVNFQMTISKFNVRDFETVNYIFSKEGDLPIFTFSYESVYFNNLQKDVSTKLLERKNLFEMIDYIQKKYPLKNIESFIPKLYLRLAKRFFQNPKKPILPCEALNSTLTIDAYGNLKPCSYFPFHFANVREINYKILEFLEKNRRLVKSIREGIHRGNCPVCWTNCEAYPTIFIQPIKAILKSLF